MRRCFDRSQRILTWLGLFLASVLLLTAAAAARAGEAEEGFKPLFDGKSLDGWDGDPLHWRVENGVIVGETSAEHPIKPNSFLIWRRGEVDDFELRYEYRFQSPWGNSGVQYRSFEVPDKISKWVVGGYQADFARDDVKGDRYSGILYGERYRGILAQRGQKTVIGDDHKPKVVEQFAKPEEFNDLIKKDDWNSYRVVAQGYHYVQEINGKTTVDVTDEDKAQRRRSGIIALQLHQGPPMRVEFRNIRLKRLKLSDAKKIVFVAGKPSHGYGAHEHNAGCLLLAKCLNENMPNVVATVYRSGWPQDPTALDNADAIVIFSDGGGGHPVIPHLDEVAPLMKKGMGLACLHYAVEVPKGKPGDCLLSWIGGYFEPFWSVNPHWTANYKVFPQHPVTRGVRPFTIDDEWYYHMRFLEDMAGVTPILTCVPPDATHDGRNDAHAGNPVVHARKGQPEHMAWVTQRPDGGRGFGFTGAHHHWNWANDSFRTVVLNAIVWVAGLDVPADGVPSKTPTLAELQANLDNKPKPANFKPEEIQKMIDGWKSAAPAN